MFYIIKLRSKIPNPPNSLPLQTLCACKGVSLLFSFGTILTFSSCNRVANDLLGRYLIDRKRTRPRALCTAAPALGVIQENKGPFLEACKLWLFGENWKEWTFRSVTLFVNILLVPYLSRTKSM